MDLRKNMIIAKQKIITPDVRFCKYNDNTKKYDIALNNGKIYSYNYNNVIWIKESAYLEPADYQITHNNRLLFDISEIYLFEHTYHRYFHIIFGNGKESDYAETDLEIEKSVLTDKNSNFVFMYLKNIANKVCIKSENNINIIEKQYEKIKFVPDKSALALYLNPPAENQIISQNEIPIFPFGCNTSQYIAVKNALENKISVIQGPPGTGKTQTILNIAANLIIKGKTVQIVSNNNSATENIFEKLSQPKYNMSFIVAQLGRKENREKFISTQSGLYPDITQWQHTIDNKEQFFNNVHNKSLQLSEVFKKQARKAFLTNELNAVITEQKYFNEYIQDSFTDIKSLKLKQKITSYKILILWHECENYSKSGNKPSFIKKLKFKRKYGLTLKEISKYSYSKIITALQKTYYEKYIKEITNELSHIYNYLENINAENMLSVFTDLSMIYFKNFLYEKYKNNSIRPIFNIKDLTSRKEDFLNEYPVILSTTHSSKSNVNTNYLFDYVIIDEASQVDIVTGALALSSAKNAVIVGDTKQLPNIVDDKDKIITDSVFNRYNIKNSYKFSEFSFLSSVISLMPSIPNVILREHYRCNPAIINFCNQKFYNNELLVMTEEKSGNNSIVLIKTVPGNHERDRTNQRQIDSIKSEIFNTPDIDYDNIGIIAPYNNQINALKNEFNNTNLDIATIHKFQGREKDTIIFSTVDNTVTPFSDNADLLNVAVSRAKNKFILVTSGNKQPENSNLNDLISYIEYNNFEIKDSKIYSVFDYLYRNYSTSKQEYLKKNKKISEYDSENLMYVLINEVLNENNYINLAVICHVPLKMIIKNPELLNDEECKYTMNNLTHVDFLIYNKINKQPVLTVEVDGYNYHKKGTKQAQRDIMKNKILELYNIPLIRFATNGSEEKTKLTEKLNDLYHH